MSSERLSAIETGYLLAERPGYPIHVGSVATLDARPLLDDQGRLRLDELRVLLASRLDLLPQLRRHLTWTPFGLGRPRWEDDPSFDLDNHLDVVEAPAPGDDDALRQIAAATWSELLDRAHPLWHLRFVTGLDGNRVGLIERAHHAMVDGVAGVDVAAVLFDTRRDVPVPHPCTWRPAAPAPALVRSIIAVGDTVRDWTSVAAGAGATLVHPSGLTDQARTVAHVVTTLTADGLAPHSSLNAPTGTDRRLGWVRARLSDVKAAGAEAGGTANDVVLAAVAGGIRSLLLRRAEVIASGATLKVLVPVSLRRPGEHGDLGNRVSGLVLPLPIGIGDPDARLRAVVEATARLKASHHVAATADLLGAADLLPTATIRVLAAAVHRQPLVNLVVTNVPGPDVPLYLMGARLLEAFPIVPLVGNLSVGVAVLSYDGALNIGLTADVATCADVDLLLDGIEHGLATLCAGRAGSDGAVVSRS